ncbi:MAG TPA: hypothetical protein VNW49_01520, partial [Puia sp.]|nr:hypothetical protein [Puia sp.]
IPNPVSNYPLTLIQSGSPGAPIAIGVASSYADTVTDNQGHFVFKFTQGSGTFLGFPISNNNRVDLFNYTTSGLPRIFMTNFPYDSKTPLDPIYLCKKVDTVIIRVLSLSSIISTDSFTIFGNNLTGAFQHVITGLTISANSELNLDSVINGTFSSFDFKTKKYRSDFAITSNHHFFSDNMDSLAEYDDTNIILNFSCN